MSNSSYASVHEHTNFQRLATQLVYTNIDFMNTLDTDSTATDKGREKLLDRIQKLYAMDHENE